MVPNGGGFAERSPGVYERELSGFFLRIVGSFCSQLPGLPEMAATGLYIEHDT